jgi:hypothetical protein
MIQFSGHPNLPDERASHLNDIIFEIVTDFAPQEISIAHGKEMSASIAALILSGAVVQIGQTESGGPTGAN